MTTEEESIEQASNARREMLKALRAAKEYASVVDGDPLQNENEGEDAMNDQGEKFVEEEEHGAVTAHNEVLKPQRMAKELSITPDEGATQNTNSMEVSKEAEDKGLTMKFRNYLPHDKQLQEGKLTPTTLPKFEDPVASEPPLSSKIEDPFVNIAPKKPNWDLRRDVQKRLDKLERRTLKALNELMQEQEKEREAMEMENGASED